ncbi:MAG TPA: CGNR zinc finger domain-containing protein [Stellaceae bacterium]|nr:CGNR zinc finger domain-containing protein [Stellaceae bacterium]
MTVTLGTPWIAAPAEELCLDFANTRYWRGTAQPREELAGLGELLGWCAAKAGLPDAERDALALWASTEAAAAAALLAEALALREALYRLFHAIAAKTAPAAADLLRLNGALAHTTPRRAVEPRADGFGWRVAAGEAGAVRLLTPVLWSAGDLLVGKRLAKVRHCANPDCQWLFLDDSKSGNRRWCSMSACGNRAKAHRHYARKKGAGGPETDG